MGRSPVFKEQNMKRTTTIASIALIASSAFAGAAAAGSLEDTTVEAPVFTPAPTPVAVDGDWTGFYTGLQGGQTDIDSDSGTLDGDARPTVSTPVTTMTSASSHWVVNSAMTKK